MKLVEMKREPWDEIVAYLEEKVAQAKRGEIRAMCLVIEHDTGEMGFHAFHGAGSYPVKMVGELEVAKWAVMHRHCTGGG